MLYSHGLKLLLCNSLLNKKKEKEYFDLLKASQVDGIILGSHTMSVEDYKSINLPIVTIDRQITDSIPYISSDNYEGGKLATKLLIDKKCTKIAYISGNLQLNLLATKRHDAFIEQVRAKEIEFVVKQTKVNGFSLADYQKLVRSLFQEHPDVDGIFASSDIIAMEVIKECHRLGKSVPDQVRVVGYDGIEQGYFNNWEITTIEQPIKDMGRLAVQYLVQLIAGEEPPIETILPVKLLDRGTV